MSDEQKQTQEGAEEIVDAQDAAESGAGSEITAEQVQALEAKAQENYEMFVRAKAELQNYQRRAEKDLESAHKYSKEKFAKELLPVIDSLELGLVAASAENADLAKVIEGSELTLKMFEQAFDRLEITVVDPAGAEFNPEFHQAISMQETPDAKPNTVLSVVQKGYSLGARIIRPAMVVVAKAPAAQVKIDEQA